MEIARPQVIKYVAPVDVVRFYLFTNILQKAHILQRHLITYEACLDVTTTQKLHPISNALTKHLKDVLVFVLLITIHVVSN